MAVLSEDFNVSSSFERVRGFRFGLFEAGISLDPKNIFACESNIKDGKRVASEILHGAERPTALFCCNDLLAIGALQAAKEEGISVPEQLSIIGFDDTILSTVTNPTLTTIAQPMNQMVKMAFDLLIGSLDHTDDIKQRIVLQPELVIRESTGNSPIK